MIKWHGLKAKWRDTVAAKIRDWSLLSGTAKVNLLSKYLPVRATLLKRSFLPQDGLPFLFFYKDFLRLHSGVIIAFASSSSQKLNQEIVFIYQSFIRNYYTYLAHKSKIQVYVNRLVLARPRRASGGDILFSDHSAILCFSSFYEYVCLTLGTKCELSPGPSPPFDPPISTGV